jgi:hypothetical protein
MMKKLTFLLSAILLLILTTKVSAQENNDQLWYCWEETVKPENIDDYLAISKEFLDLCKSENFPFPVFTWRAKPYTYELWSPINSLNDIEKLNTAWKDLSEKLGEEKFKAFQNTKLHNRGYTCTIKNDLSYDPANPEYGRNELKYSTWIELYIKEGKQKEYEEAQKWINEQRAQHDFGCWVFVATGDLGFETPCYIVMGSHKSREEHQKAFGEINEKMKEEWDEFMNRIQPLMRKPNKYYDWYLLPELSYWKNSE